jgi:hypothetical protein
MEGSDRRVHPGGDRVALIEGAGPSGRRHIDSSLQSEDEGARMYTIPNPFSFQNNFGFNSPNTFNPMNAWQPQNTIGQGYPQFPFVAPQGINNWNWNQYGVNTPSNWQQPANCFGGACNTGVSTPWNATSGYGFTPNFGGTPVNAPIAQPWNAYGYNAPIAQPWNAYGQNTPGMQYPSYGQYPMNFNGYQGSQFGQYPINNGVPFTNWNYNQFQNIAPFPGLYNFSNSYSPNTIPFGGFPVNPVNSTFPYAPALNGWSIPQNVGFNPLMTTPNFNTMPFAGGWNGMLPFNFGWNTPIFWGQMGKNDVEVTGKKGDVHASQNRVAYPVGFGPFGPFGYANADAVKGNMPACAA